MDKKIHEDGVTITVKLACDKEYSSCGRIQQNYF